MKIHLLKIVPAIFVLSLMAGPVTAQTTAQTVVDAVIDGVLGTVFTKEEKRIIDIFITDRGGLPRAEESEESEEYDDDTRGKGKKNKHAKKGKGKHKKLPPGLAKRKELPPGLERRHTLPPGLAVRELPEDLLSQLPPSRPGTDRIIVEDDIVLIEKATGRILDIILGRGKTQ